MNCSVCSKGMGLWASLNARPSSRICKTCHDYADTKLDSLMKSARNAASLRQEYARKWIDQFEETVRKYQVPQSNAAILRSQLLRSFFEVVEKQEEITEEEAQFLVSLAKQYELGESASPELGNIIHRIGMLQTIQAWEKGEVPDATRSPLVPPEMAGAMLAAVTWGR